MPIKTYTNPTKGYSVTINHDGSIHAKQGDWLSKYSMAIHGDTDHVEGEYLRKINGDYYNITNVDLIFTDETIYHKKSIPNWGTIHVKSGGGVPYREPKGINIDEVLKKSGIHPSKYDQFAWLLRFARFGQFGVTVGTTFELSVPAWLLAPSTAAAAAPYVAVGAPIAGALLGILAGCYALWKARSYGIQQTGMRGVTYGAVAWAFGHGLIGLPKALEKSLTKNAAMQNLSDEVRLYRNVWIQAVAKSQSTLNAWVRDNKLAIKDAKILIQSESLVYAKTEQPDPRWLAAGLLLDASDAYSITNNRNTFLQPWSYYPNDKFAGRPTYPPKIDARYPF